LSKRLPRDRLQAADVIPYREDGEERTPNLDAEQAFQGCRDFEFDSLDLIHLGPYLLLMEAQAKAAALIDAARQEAEVLLEQARSGGAAQGREEAKQEIMPSVVAFANAGQTLIVFEQQMIARYAPEMVRLALAIAEKIVHKIVAADPEIIASVLDRARREVVDARRIRVHLNPKDYELLAEARPDLLTMGHDSGREIEIVADEDVGRGGSRLETEIGVVDATLPTQIAEIRRQLLDEEVRQTSDMPLRNAVGAEPAVAREL
jgi:flagellar biosynthesis/type III secretory pathway protein FliH